MNGAITNRLRGATSLSERADYLIPHYKLTPTAWRKQWLRGKLTGITHLIAESNVPIFSDPKTTRFVDEIGFYAELGISSAIVFHGSDARDPELSLELDAHSYFRDAERGWVDLIGAQAAHNRESVRQAGLPVFVTTPDMLDHVPDAHLLPISIDPHHWQMEHRPFGGGLPRVLHNPSSPLTKGTRYITPVLEDLERQGRIEIVRKRAVPHHRMRELYQTADIVVDSIQVGAYGVTALEAMAAGRLVIAHVPDHIRKVMGDNIPVVEASPSTFRAVMDDLLTDVNKMIATAAAGMSHVRRWHDGRAAADTIAQFMTAGSGTR
ncbi:glycosyltransferase [Glaciibacter superstes]|uniref:glycosyltransferase n=1 Tax=Glaciibacter superstes TaxID=501023 RepID=UPI0003B6C07A|nr:glycosyltransferase [Glaciibacter superstes]